MKGAAGLARTRWRTRPMATIAPQIGLADHGRIMTLGEFLDADVEAGHPL